MRTVGKVGLIFFSLTLASTTVSYGDDSMGTQIQHKFIRGVTNTFTGWVEIPKQMYLRTSEGPPVIGAVQGVMEGIGMAFARTTAGLYEVATFPVPLPWHYKPLFEPEYVWQGGRTDHED